MSLAANLFGHYLNFLDHIAPLASLLKIPLFITEKKIYETAVGLYPDLQVNLYEDYASLTDFLKGRFQGIVSCNYHQTLKNSVDLLLNKTPLYYIWMPHGNSDKSMKEKLFYRILKHEKTVLAYGPKMLDAFKEHGVSDRLQTIVTGNFRLAYFQKHADFYRQKTGRLINFPDKGKKTLFYAPSWGNEIKNRHIIAVLKILIKHLKKHFNLIIKPHPFSLKRISYEFPALQKEKDPGIIFVENFHAIYPLLEKADVYLGDFSSVGYDFLFYNRPMFFLNYADRRQQKAADNFLFQCGVEIKNRKEIVSTILKGAAKDPLFLKQKREKIYHYTFAPAADFSRIKEKLQKTAACSGSLISD